MADMTRIKGRIAETIYPNGKGAITAESHQALLLEMVDDINEKKADKEEVTTVEESVSMLSQEVESNYINLTESLDALEQKLDNLPQGGGDVKADGVYPDLTAGDLAGRGESVPAEFGFRASGGKSIKDGRAYIKRIKGNSVVWNNMVDTRGYEGQLFITTGIRIVKGHKYLLYRTETKQGLYLIPTVNGADNYDMVIREGQHSGIFQAQYSDDKGQGTVYSETYCGACIISDLTQMFGVGYEPRTIEEFQSRVATLGIDMYAYNEGQVIHCNTESIKSIGDNAWDEQWENGTFNITTGDNNDYGDVLIQIRSKNPIKILPDAEYYTTKQMWIIFEDADHNVVQNPQHNGYTQGNSIYVSTGEVFKTPINASYMRFYMLSDYGNTYNHDLLISLYHSGWKQDTDAGYQPYWQDTLPLPIIRKYFPDGMKSAGTAHDEIRFNKASGKWEYSKGKIKSVDLGQENITYTSGDISKFSFDLPNAKVIASTDKANVMCPLYVGAIQEQAAGKDKVIYRASTFVGIYDSAYNSAATFKAAMQGVMLYYESNDWEWVKLDAEDQNFRDYYNVADFGTEQSQSEVPSANFSADIIYQFNAVDMIREHELEITELQNVIETMQAQLTSLINGGQ